jgi:hypothetical protein
MSSAFLLAAFACLYSQYPMEKLCYAATPDESSAVIAAMAAATSLNTSSSCIITAPFELQRAAAVTGASFRDSGFKVLVVVL